MLRLYILKRHRLKWAAPRGAKIFSYCDIRKMGTVYRIVNSVNDMIYIGSTMKTIEQRFDDHLTRAQCLDRKAPIHVAMREHGLDKFQIEMIESVPDCTRAELLEREAFHQHAADKSTLYNERLVFTATKPRVKNRHARINYMTQYNKHTRDEKVAMVTRALNTIICALYANEAPLSSWYHCIDSGSD